MDEIQKTLIEAGRKDLAQKYYEKTAVKYNEVFGDPDKILRMKDTIIRLVEFDKNDLLKTPDMQAANIRTLIRNKSLKKLEKELMDFARNNLK